jgi:hypothetical protein
MSYVLVLLFIAPFIDRKESRWFMSVYAFILLAAKELRVHYGIVGEDFFLYTSYTQIICMCASIFLLEGLERKTSVALFFIYAAYNFSISTWWGYVPLLFHTWVTTAIILLQTMVVTFGERGLLKNTLMVGVAFVVSFTADRYI